MVYRLSWRPNGDGLDVALAANRLLARGIPVRWVQSPVGSLEAGDYLIDCPAELGNALHGQNLHLETGQETADHLLHFINEVDRDNLFINFDPANMILCGTGEPCEALKKVGKFVRSIHCKDATWATEGRRGLDWGCEVALGDGDVGMENYLQTLNALGYDGPLTIEREIPEDPTQQKADIGKAVSLLTEVRTKILG